MPKSTDLVGLVLGFACLAGAPATHAQAQAAKTPPVTPHEIAGRAQCTMCHSGAMPNIKAVPADHKAIDNSVCQLCHAQDAPLQAAPPRALPHAVAGREQCLACHGGTVAGMKAAPASHKTFEVKQCQLCHTPADAK